MERTVDYSGRITAIMEELKTKTLAEAERERNIDRFDYTGIGYGYNFKTHYPKSMKEAEKDIQTPELKRLEKLIASMG
jgi:hypothetical protein